MGRVIGLNYGDIIFSKEDNRKSNGSLDNSYNVDSIGGYGVNIGDVVGRAESYINLESIRRNEPKSGYIRNVHNAESVGKLAWVEKIYVGSIIGNTYSLKAFDNSYFIGSDFNTGNIMQIVVSALSDSEIEVIDATVENKKT